MFHVIPIYGTEVIAEYSTIWDAIKGYVRCKATTPCLLVGDDGTELADSRQAFRFIDADLVVTV